MLKSFVKGFPGDSVVKNPPASARDQGSILELGRYPGGKERKGKERKVKSLSRVRLFETPWTVAYQAPLSMGFSRQ